MPRIIIDDGQNIDFCLKSEDGDHFYGTRRPTLGGERRAVTTRANRAIVLGDSADHDAAFNELIAKKLVRWNVQDASGKVVPITVENVNWLDPDLWDRLTDVVLGYVWGDLPKDATPEQKAEFERALAAANTGQLPGDAVVEAAAKNS